MPKFLGLLCGQARRRAAARWVLTLLQQAIQHIERSGERATEAETYRLYAKLLAARDMADFPAAEANLEKAIEIARAQQAKGWELRAVTTLARMLQQRDQRRQARSALAPSMNGSRKASTHPISRRPEHCSLSFNRGRSVRPCEGGVAGRFQVRLILSSDPRGHCVDCLFRRNKRPLHPAVAARTMLAGEINPPLGSDDMAVQGCKLAGHVESERAPCPWVIVPAQLLTSSRRMTPGRRGTVHLAGHLDRKFLALRCGIFPSRRAS